MMDLAAFWTAQNINQNVISPALGSADGPHYISESKAPVTATSVSKAQSLRSSEARVAKMQSARDAQETMTQLRSRHEKTALQQEVILRLKQSPNDQVSQPHETLGALPGPVRIQQEGLVYKSEAAADNTRQKGSGTTVFTTGTANDN